MKTILLPSLIIMSIAWITWMALYPQIIWGFLTFRYRETKTETAICFAIWLYAFAFAGCVTWLCTFIG